MENNRKLSASCVVIREDKVLLVKHTYGAAKGKYLIPGGFSEDGELPQNTAEREVLEETGVSVKAKELLAVRFTEQEVWCIFRAEYVEGEPASDNGENEEALFVPVQKVLTSNELVATTKEIVKAALAENKEMLRKSKFVNEKFNADTWQLFI